MRITTSLNKVKSIGGEVGDVGWALRVSEWSPTDAPSFAYLCYDCNSPAKVGILGAVNSIPVIGTYARVIAKEGAKLLDAKYINQDGSLVGGFEVVYTDGEIVYPWSKVDLSSVEDRLTELEENVQPPVDLSSYATISSLSAYATIASLSNYALKTYVTTSIANVIAALPPAQPSVFEQIVVDSTVLNSHTRDAGFIDVGVKLTTRSSLYGVGVPATNQWCNGLSVVKTKAVDGAAFTVISPLQRTGTSFALTDTDTSVSPAFIFSAGLSGFAANTATKGIGVRGYIDSGNDSATIVPGTEGILGLKEADGKLWAGCFFGNVYIGGNAVLNGTATGWPDFVLAADYELQNFDARLSEMLALGNLPFLPSASEIEKSGLHVMDILRGLTRHIEELYLYIGEMRNGTGKI